MLGIIEALYRPEGLAGNPFRGAELAGVEAMQPRLWTMANSDERGMTAEFPFATPTGSALHTSLLQVVTEEEHPVLGSGLLIRLTLPQGLDDGAAQRIANRLNLLEATALTRCPGQGAWCVGRLGLTHVAFLPALAYRRGLLQNLVLGEAIRNRWAQEVIPQVLEPRASR